MYYGKIPLSPTDEVSAIDPINHLSINPKLDAPERLENSKHMDAVLALKNRLAKELEEIREEEVESSQMENTSTDSRILKALFAAHMRQRNLQTTVSL